MTMDFAENTRRSCQEYIEALEKERRKIEVFHRELPLSLYIVSQAIESCKQQMATESLVLGRSDGEETSSEGHPVLEEFIPLKGRSDSSDKEEVEEETTGERGGKKPDWLRSVQLWNQNSHPPADEESSRKPAAAVVEIKKKVGGAFHPFRAEKKMAAAAASSSAETGSRSRPREEKEGRKARRCWSPELHRRFLNALQQLGGPDAATPKQIKELMKVDGLTNDEVKSHLQKYRLHTRRPGAATHGRSNSTQQSPQLVVVGGIWVPPPEYAMATKTMETTHVYAPVPSPLLQKEGAQQSPSGPLQWMMGRCSLDEDHANSSTSPATSSSSHTTTTSPTPAI